MGEAVMRQRQMSSELFTLAAAADEAAKLPDKAAQDLIARGTHAVLIKTSHDSQSADIDQFLYYKEGQGSKLAYQAILPRLPGEYHGSGCSLASFIAGRLALGDDLATAVQLADIWIQQVLRAADIPHEAGQRIPKRFHYL